MPEFSIIHDFFAPLATKSPFSLDLLEDGAIFPPQSNNQCIATDGMVEGVHFLKDTPPKHIAKRLLRINLSDMAAMGATPHSYLLTIATPYDSDRWFQAFTEGLAEDQEQFNIDLIGGDSMRHQGALFLSITMMGSVKHGHHVTRGGSQVGDDIYVTGTIGDAMIGLALKQKKKLAGLTNPSWFIERYELPTPRVAFGSHFSPFVTSALDVSDGLLGDMQHLIKNSGNGMKVHLDAIPHHPDVTTLFISEKELHIDAISNSDDYEILFTASPTHAEALMALAQDTNTPITRIGTVTESGTLEIVDQDENPIPLSIKGYDHFR